MKKRYLLLAFFLVSVLLVTSGLLRTQVSAIIESESAANESEDDSLTHGESIEIVLQDLLSNQGVDTIQKLDCGKVSDDDLERLGDAVMEQAHPGEAHAVMDKMMGGEGSETLQQMHINVGSAYLGCSRGGFGMMGGAGMMGMMGYKNGGIYNGENNNSKKLSMMGPGSIMGFNGWMMNGFGVLGSLAFISLIIFLLAGAYFFVKQSGKK